ncbi:MAG: virulence factor SrfC family protein, partial [Pseudomonadota bacterium]
KDWDGAPFDNVYFLRNPGMKQVHLMRYSDEAALREDRPVENDVFAVYRRAFMTSDLTARHFRDREAVWDAAMEPNDGGVRYLVENIDAVLDPGLKQAQAAERLIEAAAALATPLRGLHHAEGDEARKEQDAKMTRLRVALNAAFQRSELRAFAHLRRAMMLDPADVRGVFLNTAALRQETLDEMAGAAALPADHADDPWADHGTVEAVEAPVAKRRERPDVFAESLMNRWADQLRRLQRDDRALGELGVAPETIGVLIDELLIGASRVGLLDRIAELARRETRSASVRWVEVADRVAQIAAMRVNDFVAYLGYADVPAAERPGFPEAPKEASRAIFTLGGLATPGEAVGDAPEMLERIAFIDWGVALRAFGVENVGHAAGREISEDQNRRLAEILDLIDVGRTRAKV